MTVNFDGVIHGIGCQIELAGPGYGTTCEEDLVEKIRLTQGLKNAGEMGWQKFHFTTYAVCKLDPQSQRTRNGYGDYGRRARAQAKGKIFLGCCFDSHNCQSSISSVRCIAAHSRTSA